MATVYCKYCRYCEKDDVSSTRSEFRKGDDMRYWCTKYKEMVYEYDSCKNGEE